MRQRTNPGLMDFHWAGTIREGNESCALLACSSLTGCLLIHAEPNHRLLALTLKKKSSFSVQRSHWSRLPQTFSCTDSLLSLYLLVYFASAVWLMFDKFSWVGKWQAKNALREEPCCVHAFRQARDHLSKPLTKLERITQLFFPLLWSYFIFIHQDKSNIFFYCSVFDWNEICG